MLATFTGNNPASPQNNNRIDGYSYDSAGNLLADATHTYFYDAENRLIQVDGTAGTCASGSTTGTTACYLYDAEGRRIYRSGFTDDTCYSDPTGKREYVYDLSGRVLVENEFALGNGCFTEVYAGGRHLARQGYGNTYFHHADWLGTVRLVNTYANPTYGAETCTSLPFGDALNCNSNANNVYHFTGKERDPETGLDNFGRQGTAYRLPGWRSRSRQHPNHDSEGARI